MTVSWTNGSYDGNILIAKQGTSTILNGTLDNSNLTTKFTGAPSLAWGSTDIDGVIFNSPATQNDIRYINDQVGSSTSSVIVTGLTSKLRYTYRIIDFTGGADKAARTYQLGSAVTNSRTTSAKDGDEFSQPGTTNSISAISPNPARDYITFDMDIAEDTYVTITIHSLEGSVVMNVKANELFTAGTHNINIPLTGFTAGAYAISISFGQEAILETFMVMP
jgi:hypothetical protein